MCLYIGVKAPSRLWLFLFAGRSQTLRNNVIAKFKAFASSQGFSRESILTPPPAGEHVRQTHTHTHESWVHLTLCFLTNRKLPTIRIWTLSESLLFPVLVNMWPASVHYIRWSLLPVAPCRFPDGDGSVFWWALSLLFPWHLLSFKHHRHHHHHPVFIDDKLQIAFFFGWNILIILFLV